MLRKLKDRAKPLCNSLWKARLRAARLSKNCFYALKKHLHAPSRKNPSPSRPWLSFSYYRRRVAMLNPENRETFADEFFRSSRQVDAYVIFTAVLLFASYLAYSAWKLITLAELGMVSLLLICFLFYIVRRHRKDLDSLLDALIESETAPDYFYGKKKS